MSNSDLLSAKLQFQTKGSSSSDSLSLPLPEKGLSTPSIVLLSEVVTLAEKGRWKSVNQPRLDGVAVEFAFGAASFLAGATNSDLDNLIKLFQGMPISGITGTVKATPGNTPNAQELCKSCPVLIRARISQDRLPRPDLVDDMFVTAPRDYEVLVKELTIKDITHIGIFQARHESLNKRWESQLLKLQGMVADASMTAAELVIIER